jgi:hypothetical protein
MYKKYSPASGVWPSHLRQARDTPRKPLETSSVMAPFICLNILDLTRIYRKLILTRDMYLDRGRARKSSTFGNNVGNIKDIESVQVPHSRYEIQ